MAPKFALFTKGSKLPLNKGFKNMFELLQSCAQPSIWSLLDQNIVWKSKAKNEPFHPRSPIQIPLQRVQIQMRWLVMSHLIRIYTVCHSYQDLHCCYSVIDFWLKLLFATMDMSKFRERRVYCRNSGAKELTNCTFVKKLRYSCALVGQYKSTELSFNETVI